MNEIWFPAFLGSPSEWEDRCLCKQLQKPRCVITRVCVPVPGNVIQTADMGARSSHRSQGTRGVASYLGEIRHLPKRTLPESHSEA